VPTNDGYRPVRIIAHNAGQGARGALFSSLEP
jgi:hypothetical protein